MTQEKNDTDNKNSDKNVASKGRRSDIPPKKVIIRRLPPSIDQNTFLEQISPVPDHDYFHFVKGSPSLGENAFSRAYINFLNIEDIMIFQEKFDGYIFVDSQGQEYSALVEMAPFQKVPKKKVKKADPKMATIDNDPEYTKFLESLESEETCSVPPPETFLEEIEAKERELRANHGVLKVSTPLIDYIVKRKEEKKLSLQRAREEKKRKELERKRLKEEERRRRKEKERQRERERLKLKEERETGKKKAEEVPQTKVVLLKNPEREKDKDEEIDAPKADGKPRESEFKGQGDSRYKDRGAARSDNRGKSWKEREREREREKGRDRPREVEKEKSGRKEAHYTGEEKYGKSRNTQTKSSEQSARPRETTGSRDAKKFRDDYPEKKYTSRDPRDSKERKEMKDPKETRDQRDREVSERSKASNGRDKPHRDTFEVVKDDKKAEKPEARVSMKEKESSPSSEDIERSEKRLKEERREGSSETGDESSKGSRQKIRYKDRPERAIYNPARRAAERRKEAESKREDKSDRSQKGDRSTPSRD